MRLYYENDIMVSDIILLEICIIFVGRTAHLLVVVPGPVYLYIFVQNLELSSTIFVCRLCTHLQLQSVVLQYTTISNNVLDISLTIIDKTHPYYSPSSISNFGNIKRMENVVHTHTLCSGTVITKRTSIYKTKIYMQCTQEKIRHKCFVGPGVCVGVCESCIVPNQNNLPYDIWTNITDLNIRNTYMGIDFFVYIIGMLKNFGYKDSRV